MRYRVRAYNTATASTNKIHDDAVARGLGFRGGLVPGVDLYAYLCHLPAERWGRDWLERGTITARFSSPVYDGDEVEITGSAAGDGALDLVLTDPTGTECVAGRAALPGEPPEPPPIAAWPGRDPPEAAPVATPEIFTTRPFGRLTVHFRAQRYDEYLDASASSCRYSVTNASPTRAGCCASPTTSSPPTCASGRGSTSRAPCSSSPR